MKEYRDLRARVSFMELCHTPELAAEVTVHAAQVLKTDAAILFADILLILELFGPKVSLVKGKGPVIEPPLRDPSEIAKLPEPDLSQLDSVYKAVSLIRAELPPEVALIGFAGAPFTVASYLIEGGPSKNFAKTKAMMFGWLESAGLPVSICAVRLRRAPRRSSFLTAGSGVSARKPTGR